MDGTYSVGFAGETSAYWININADGITFPPSLNSHGYINGNNIRPGTYTYFPSIDVNSIGVVACGFSALAPTEFAGAYAALQDASEILHPAEVVKEGAAPYFLVNDNGSNCWGDFTGMALDPADDRCFWAFNQYAEASNCAGLVLGGGQFGCWNKAWARLCVD